MYILVLFISVWHAGYKATVFVFLPKVLLF